jgi:hypothetical protein
MLLPVRSLPPTTRHSASLHRTVPSREVKKPVQITGGRRSEKGPGGTEYVVYVSLFLAGIGCNLVDDFVFLTVFATDGRLHTTLSCSFPCCSPCCQGLNPLSTALPPHRTITALKLQEFSPGRWIAISYRRTVNYNQATRCHNPQYGNVPTPWLCYTDD